MARLIQLTGAHTHQQQQWPGLSLGEEMEDELWALSVQGFNNNLR